MRRIGLLLLTLIFAFAIAAPAAESNIHDRYKWRDAQGDLHYDDSLPTEALKYGYDVVNPNGIVIKHVDRPKTPEEIKADEETSAHKAAQQHSAEDQIRKDQQMLSAYPDEHELISAQQAQLDMIDQNVRTTQVSLNSQEKSLSDMLARAANLDRNDKPVPAALQQQIDKQRQVVERQKAYIVEREQEKIGMAQKFADELAHYRELRTKAQR